MSPFRTYLSLYLLFFGDRVQPTLRYLLCCPMSAESDSLSICIQETKNIVIYPEYIYVCSSTFTFLLGVDWTLVFSYIFPADIFSRIILEFFTCMHAYIPTPLPLFAGPSRARFICCSFILRMLLFFRLINALYQTLHLYLFSFLGGWECWTNTSLLHTSVLRRLCFCGYFLDGHPCSAYIIGRIVCQTLPTLYVR